MAFITSLIVISTILITVGVYHEKTKEGGFYHGASRLLPCIAGWISYCIVFFYSPYFNFLLGEAVAATVGLILTLFFMVGVGSTVGKWLYPSSFE